MIDKSVALRRAFQNRDILKMLLLDFLGNVRQFVVAFLQILLVLDCLNHIQPLTASI